MIIADRGDARPARLQVEPIQVETVLQVDRPAVEPIQVETVITNSDASSSPPAFCDRPSWSSSSSSSAVHTGSDGSRAVSRHPSPVPSSVPSSTLPDLASDTPSGRSHQVPAASVPAVDTPAAPATPAYSGVVAPGVMAHFDQVAATLKIPLAASIASLGHLSHQPRASRSGLDPDASHASEQATRGWSTQPPPPRPDPAPSIAPSRHPSVGSADSLSEDWSGGHTWHTARGDTPVPIPPVIHAWHIVRHHSGSGGGGPPNDPGGGGGGGGPPSQGGSNAASSHASSSRRSAHSLPRHPAAAGGGDGGDGGSSGGGSGSSSSGT